MSSLISWEDGERRGIAVRVHTMGPGDDLLIV